MSEYPYKNNPMGGGECEPNRISVTPEWVIEYEKEQNDKLAILEKLVKIKRDYAFVESGFGSREKKDGMLAMVGAYDVVLKLIEKAIGGK